jgi:hypothetical protein
MEARCGWFAQRLKVTDFVRSSCWPLASCRQPKGNDGVHQQLLKFFSWLRGFYFRAAMCASRARPKFPAAASKRAPIPLAYALDLLSGDGVARQLWDGKLLKCSTGGIILNELEAERSTSPVSASLEHGLEGDRVEASERGYRAGPSKHWISSHGSRQKSHWSDRARN